MLGGAIAFHKCIWQVIGWNYTHFPPTMKTKSEYSIKLVNRTGAKNEIKQLPIKQPNVGLGCRLAPDGNQKHESAFCLEQCKRIQGKVSTASLTFEEAYQYLLTRVVPAVCYALAVTDIPQKVCRKMNTYIDLVMLPKIGLNRHTPKAVVYGPMNLGGLNYPQFKTLQTAKLITYLLKQMR